MRDTERYAAGHVLRRVPELGRRRERHDVHEQRTQKPPSAGNRSIPLTVVAAGEASLCDAAAVSLGAAARVRH